MAESIWVGRDEHEGVRREGRLAAGGGRPDHPGNFVEPTVVTDLPYGHALERDEIHAGVVYVNRRAGATTGAWPGTQTFCGWKSSGSTGKGGLGPYYLAQFMREQSRTVVG